jgi:hypothetical protein
MQARGNSSHPALPPFRAGSGGHFHDAIAVGNCTCKDFKRFAFDDDDVREGLAVCGAPFGILPQDL